MVSAACYRSCRTVVAAATVARPDLVAVAGSGARAFAGSAGRSVGSGRAGQAVRILVDVASAGVGPADACACACAEVGARAVVGCVGRACATLGAPLARA